MHTLARAIVWLRDLVPIAFALLALGGVAVVAVVIIGSPSTGGYVALAFAVLLVLPSLTLTVETMRRLHSTHRDASVAEIKRGLAGQRIYLLGAGTLVVVAVVGAVLCVTGPARIGAIVLALGLFAAGTTATRALHEALAQRLSG